MLCGPLTLFLDSPSELTYTFSFDNDMGEKAKGIFMFEVTGLVRVFKIMDDEETAIKNFTD
jgi:hypothetical protein